MQRYILKIALACSMVFFLAATPINTSTAAERTVDTDSQNTDASELHETYYVNARNGLKVRSAPSKDSDVVTLLPYGAEVIVIGTANNSWYEIEYSNETAYVSADYITKSSKEAIDADTDSDLTETDESESIPSTMSSLENVKTTLGATPIIFALIVAIIIMILLALFTAYSFLKRDKENYNEDYDDEDYADDDYDYDDNNYNDDSEEYIDEEYYDEEYYDDEE